MFAFFSWLPPKKSEIGICLAARENISVSPHRSSVGKKKKKTVLCTKTGCGRNRNKDGLTWR